MRSRVFNALVVSCLAAAALVAVGCGELEYVPNSKWNYYHKPLPEATRAIEAAKAAGKDKDCPAEFAAALKMRNDAYATYDACNTRLAIEQATKAIAMVNALCPAKPAPPAPTIVVFTAAPSSVEAGKCATLTWNTTNATEAKIDPEVGATSPSGSHFVCPPATTTYALTATGPGGSTTERATVDVIGAPAPAPAPTPAPAPPRELARLTLHVHFDTDKAVIRKADFAELEKGAAFAQKYPDAPITVEGHTDSTGTPQHNQGLSERRADSVKKYLESHGVRNDITARGFGETRPVAGNDAAEGRARNRRVEIVILEK